MTESTESTTKPAGPRLRQYELVERVKSYDPFADEDALNRAYVYSMKAHGPQMRASGDPYFTHPLEVAGLLTEFKLDSASIITALLHDTVEDTGTTLEDLRKLFGPEIAKLVDGVTKLNKLELQSEETKQAENFRKLVLAMSDDIRVLLVKLADRLHNMRTIEHHKKPEKQRRIARETLEIYAPLAERIGMNRLKDELEDLSFSVLNPDARESILTRLSYLRDSGSRTVETVIRELTKLMTDHGLMVSVSGREKAPYSIWGKMQKKQVEFEQLSDIMAFRVMVDSIEHCYAALGYIHSAYSVVPGRFKDYISTPKANGYKSIHTTVIGPQRQRIEVQIRTHEMHDLAEDGVAAHWSYKQGGLATTGFEWLRRLRAMIETAPNPEEFLEHTKMELFQDQVFCFTPKGDVFGLPRGGTPVDFAYSIHSRIGDTTVGAKVNGRIVPLNAVLKNGDQVEIITTKNSTPNPDWERFVVTGKAKAHIRRHVRSLQREQFITLGRQMLQKIWAPEGYDYSDKALANVLKQFQADESGDILAKVGEGLLGARDVFNAVFPGHRPQPSAQQIDEQVQLKVQQRTSAVTTKLRGKDAPLPIKGLIPGMAVHYARCCHPIPGDRIVGIITTGKGVTIHTIDCETLESFAETPERWLDVSWDTPENVPESYTGRINLLIGNEPGALGTISTVIGKNGGNIINLKITSRSTDFWRMLIDIQVKDIRHLTNIIAALRAVPVINTVERANA